MRYKITDSNIQIEATSEEVEAIVATSFRVLVPRVTPILYFLHLEGASYPLLDAMKEANPAFRLIRKNHDDRTFLKHFRIVESNEALYIAPNASARLDRCFWKGICDEIGERSKG